MRVKYSLDFSHSFVDKHGNKTTVYIAHINPKEAEKLQVQVLGSLLEDLCDHCDHPWDCTEPCAEAKRLLHVQKTAPSSRRR